MKKSLLLAGILLSVVRAAAQEANPVAIPVSYSNGHAYVLTLDDESAAARKGIKRTMAGLITTINGRHDTSFTFYKTGYARNGTKFLIDQTSFSDSELSHIVYDHQDRILQTAFNSISQIGCGNMRQNMGNRVFIRNVFKGNRLRQTLMKYSTWIGGQAADTSRNEWTQEDYQYDRRGRKVLETYRIVNANSDPSIYVEKVKQYAYDKRGRLRWSVEPFDPQDTLPQDTLAMIPNNFDRLYMRQMPEWRDSFLALEYGKQWKDQALFDTIEAREDADDALLEPYTSRIRHLDGYFYCLGAAERLVKRIHLGEWNLQSHITIDSFFYDKRGRLVRWSINDLMRNKKQWTFAYDQNSRVTACDLVVYNGNGFFSKPMVNKEDTKHFLLSYNSNGTLRQIILRAMRYGKPVDELYFVAYQYY